MDIVVFAGDISDAAQQRRIDALRALGHDLRIISFRKSSIPTILSSDHLDLGEIGQQNLIKRVVKYTIAIPRIIGFLRRKNRPQIILARNLDMVLLALLLARKAPVIYECLDIHGVFVNGGVKQRIARWVERRALGRVAKLIVSAPRFMTDYFAPIQRYRGDWHLLENKIWHGGIDHARPTMPAHHPNGKIRLGWVGNIRCQNSFDLLLAVADQCPNIEIHLYGRVHHHALRDFEPQTATRKNVIVHGAYDYPAGLVDVYAQCDLVWAQDLWQAGTNSDWLLPNRVYEAAWHGCPSIAVSGSATADKITQDNIGYVIPHATPDALSKLLGDLTLETLGQKRHFILAIAGEKFQQTADNVATAITIAPRDMPDFICVGAMRAGTTTLYNYCADHPDIGVSSIKETDFFIAQKNWNRGLKWYKSLFPDGAKLRGEFSPNYSKSMVFDDVPTRIHGYLPHVKIIYIVRHPVDRAISQYNHAHLSGQSVPSLDRLIGSHEWHHIVDTSAYASQLKPYLDIFPASQVLVLSLDELKSNPARTLGQIAQFLKIPNTWNTTKTRVENTGKNLAQMSVNALRISNSAGMVWIKSVLPKSVKNLLKKMMHQSEKRAVPHFDENTRQHLWNAVADDMDDFAQMTQITFTDPQSPPKPMPLKRSA